MPMFQSFSKDSYLSDLRGHNWKLGERAFSFNPSPRIYAFRSEEYVIAEIDGDLVSILLQGFMPFGAGDQHTLDDPFEWFQSFSKDLCLSEPPQLCGLARSLIRFNPSPRIYAFRSRSGSCRGVGTPIGVSILLQGFMPFGDIGSSAQSSLAK